MRADGVGEGPFWDEAEQALWWVDIAGRSVQRWQPVTGERQRWPMPDFPSAVVLRERGGRCSRCATVSTSSTRSTGALSCSAAPTPSGRTTAATRPSAGRRGDFWLGTMDNNLHPDGSPQEMTGSTGALYRVLADGSFTREVDGVGLSNTLAWTDGGPDALVRRHADRRDLGLRRPGATAAWAPGACSATQACRAHCDGSAIDSAGYLWNARFAGSCLIRFAPDGRVDRAIDLPVTNPTCCCFGGPDLKTLYVTSARFGLSSEQISRNPTEGAVLALHTGVSGPPSVRFAG